MPDYTIFLKYIVLICPSLDAYEVGSIMILLFTYEVAEAHKVKPRVTMVHKGTSQS